MAPWSSAAHTSAGVLDADQMRLHEASLDFDTGRFRYSWSRCSAPGQCGFTLPPWQIAKWCIPDFIGPVGAATIIEAVELVWGQMVGAFQAKVSSGELCVWARVGSPTAPLVKLEPDVWRHYAVTDWPQGRARAESGDLLFSVSIGRAPASAARRSLSPEAADRLIEELKDRHANRNPMTRTDFEKHGMAKGYSSTQLRKLWTARGSEYGLKVGQSRTDFARECADAPEVK